jgi:hypothetical protein
MTDRIETDDRTGGTPESDDRIAQLIRAAGARPAVPAERAERVKAAVREHWRAGIAGRQGSRRLVGWAALAAAVLAGVWLSSSLWLRVGSGTGSVASMRVETVRSAARVLRSPGSSPALLSVDESVSVGSEVTTGPDGGVALTTHSGHSVRLDRDTRIRVLADSTIALVLGAVYVDSGAEPRGSLDIRTPVGTVRDVGTQFETRLAADGLTVRVREGSASIAAPSGAVEVEAGWEVAVDPSGRTTRREIRPDGPEWDWVRAVTPTIEIEGLAALEFLHWASRERGLALSFADSALAAEAAGILLDGSIAGMSVEQALDAVLPTCALRHRVSDGVLLVDRQPGA